jgi:hypothetical protein
VLHLYAIAAHPSLFGSRAHPFCAEFSTKKGILPGCLSSVMIQAGGGLDACARPAQTSIQALTDAPFSHELLRFGHDTIACFRYSIGTIVAGAFGHTFRNEYCHIEAPPCAAPGPAVHGLR